MQEVRKDFFEEYIREKDPDKKDKGYAWYTAIGLQAVDGIETSEYLQETARKNIEGKISVDEAEKLINSYYKSRPEDIFKEDRTEEADKVSVRLASILTEKAFTFSPTQYLSIHEKLFKGIYSHAGKIRDYNITKSEWVLDGDTVQYCGASELRATLDYDFRVEKEFSYKGLTMDEIIKHLAKFVANLWQIHVFGEGNTRTTAVFFIKYLRTLGFNVTNETFAENAWYFRNSLVRANYNNLQNRVHATCEYLEKFLGNLLFDEKNDLKNRYLHVSNLIEIPKCNSKVQNCTLDCTLDEIAILNEMKANPEITQKQLAQAIGKSVRTVKAITVSLTEKGIITRNGGKRFGKWEILM